jgi:hypothetical protein
MKDAWYETHLAGVAASRPFSFTYDGQPAAQWLPQWSVTVADERLDTHRTRRTLTWTDPKTGLEVRCVAVDYADYPLQMPGGGVIIAVGWPGQWTGSFTRDAATGLTVRAGQQLTQLHLRPGEEIRTPLIALLFSRGDDVVAAQNLWRRWYRVHNLPRREGQPQAPTTIVTVLGDEAERKEFQALVDGGVPIDILWRDAGGTRETVWFQAGDGPFNEPGMVWLNSGTWEIDTAKYPQGFRPLSDWAHARDIQFMLWFEPERVGDPNSWLGKNHPEWLLPGRPCSTKATRRHGSGSPGSSTAPPRATAWSRPSGARMAATPPRPTASAASIRRRCTESHILIWKARRPYPART